MKIGGTKPHITRLGSSCQHCQVSSLSEQCRGVEEDAELYQRLVRVHGVCDALCNRTSLPGRSKLAEWYARVALPRTAGPVRCPTIYGFDLVLDETTCGPVYRCGFYEAGTLDVMRRVLRPGDVFVDAGASVGLMSLFASQCVGDGRVLSFEPLPLRHALLAQNIAINRRANITAFPFGLGACARELSIFTDRVSPSMVAQEGSTRSELTHIERLGDVLTRERVRAVRMLKIDVEGFELDVLRGCESWLRGRDAPVICVEYGVYPTASEPLLAFLVSLQGYRLFRLRGTKRYASKLELISGSQRFRCGDNIFCMPAGTSI